MQPDRLPLATWTRCPTSHLSPEMRWVCSTHRLSARTCKEAANAQRDARSVRGCTAPFRSFESEIRVGRTRPRGWESFRGKIRVLHQHTLDGRTAITHRDRGQTLQLPRCGVEVFVATGISTKVEVPTKACLTHKVPQEVFHLAWLCGAD